MLSVGRVGHGCQRCLYTFFPLLSVVPSFPYLQSFSPLKVEWNWMSCKCGADFVIVPSDMPFQHSDKWIKTWTAQGGWLNFLNFHPLTSGDSANSAWWTQPRQIEGAGTAGRGLGYLGNIHLCWWQRDCHRHLTHADVYQVMGRWKETISLEMR